MTGSGTGAPFTLKALQDMLGVSRADVLGFIKDGFIAPERGARNTYRFGFQDVVLLRTAQSLREANISAARIRKSLRRLQALLPAEMPLSGLRITALGDDIAVREQGQPVAVDSGQLLFDFDVILTNGSVLLFPDLQSEGSSSGQPIQGDDIGNASTDYLEQGAALFDAHALDAALAAYDEGLTQEPEDTALLFNRAVVLEDMQRLGDAVQSYERCLHIDPTFADAHWNLARLYEQRGVKTLALRHFSAYRRLSR